MIDTTSLLGDDVITFDSAKAFLRQRGRSDDTIIIEAVQGAVNEAENLTNRTIRQSVTSTAYYRSWSRSMLLPKPPAQSVTSVKYYNEGDTLTTMSSSDYEVKLSSRGQGRVDFMDDFSFPVLNPNRNDPIQILFVRGWGSSSEIPGLLKVGVRLLVESIYDGDAAKRQEAKDRMQPYVFRGLP